MEQDMPDEQEGQRGVEVLPDSETYEAFDNQGDQQISGSSVTLPVLLTSFVGRERELETAKALLLRPEVRLLTFSGAGGIGKTRLALAVANEVQARFADGLYFVPLAPLTDAEHVLPTIAQVLGIQNVKDQPFLDLLITRLRSKHTLLLLDNFERVLDAASPIVDLLKGCPSLKILVTSRAILHVQGEYEFVVSPLTLPDINALPAPTQLMQYTAIALFVQRAQAARHDFMLTEQNAALVAKLCIRLDGLPLAIELAAPRLKLMSPLQLLQRLENRLQILTGGSRDLHERQQTLRDTFKWSYDLLSSDEKKLFRRLSLFRGGFTIEAVEYICQLNNDLGSTLLDMLSALLNQSLISPFEQAGGEPRLFMIETMRDFGLEYLSIAHEEESMRRQHADYYLHWMETEVLQLYGCEQVAVLGRMELELKNVRQALEWFLQDGQPESALRLASASGRFWFLRGHFSVRDYLCQGQRFFESVLPLLENESIPLQLRANVLLNYGLLLVFLNDVQGAEALGKESLELYQSLQAPQGIIQSYWLLEYCAQRRASYEEARVPGEEALRLAIELHHNFARALSLRQVALLAFFTGEYVRATALFEECLFFAQKAHNPVFLALIPRHLAEVAYAQGDYDKARTFCEESLAQSRRIALYGNIAWSQTLLAGILWHQEEGEMAFQHAEEALEGHTIMGDQQGIVWTTLWLARMMVHRQQAELARKFSEKVLPQIKMESDSWYTIAFLELLADIVLHLAEMTWCVRLWGRAVALREEIHTPLPAAEQEEYEAARTLVQTSLGETTCNILYMEGQNMSVGQVLALRNGSVKHSAFEGVHAILDSLTRRELEVLRLLATGRSNTHIAEQLTISRVTVNSYLRSIYSKLGVSSRIAAMRYAIDHHLL